MEKSVHTSSPARNEGYAYCMTQSENVVSTVLQSENTAAEDTDNALTGLLIYL